MKTINPREVYRSLISLHVMLCVITSLLIGSIYTYKNQSSQPMSSDNIWYELIIPLLALITYLISHFLGKKKYKLITPKIQLIEQLLIYKQVKIIQWTSLMGSAILAAVSFFITSQQNLILYSMMLGVMMLYFRPIKSKIIEDLNLSPDHARVLDSD